MDDDFIANIEFAFCVEVVSENLFAVNFVNAFAFNVLLKRLEELGELGEPENISVGEQFSENRSTVLREPENGSPRTRARFSENQSAP